MPKIQWPFLRDGAKIPLATFSISVTLLSSVAYSKEYRGHTPKESSKKGALGRVLGALGAFWRLLESLGSLLGASWGVPGASWSLLG